MFYEFMRYRHKFTILLISDIHFKRFNNDGSKIVDSYDEVSNALMRFLDGKKGTIDVVFVTGDLAWSGRRDQYDRAENLLLQIGKKLGFIEGSKNPTLMKDKFFLIPGNHDLDFDTIEGQKFTDKNYTTNDKIQTNRVQDLSLYFKPLKNYNKWLSDSKPMKGCKEQQLNTISMGYSKSFKINSVKLGIIGLNTTMNAVINRPRNGKVDKNQGSIVSGRSIFLSQLEKVRDCDLIFTLGHFPLTWYWHDEEKQTTSSIMTLTDFYFGGHVHSGDEIFSTRETRWDYFANVTAGAFHESSNKLSTASILLCTINMSEDKSSFELIIEPQIYSKNQFMENHNYVLPRRFPITQSFKKIKSQIPSTSTKIGSDLAVLQDRNFFESGRMPIRISEYKPYETKKLEQLLEQIHNGKVDQKFLYWDPHAGKMWNAICTNSPYKYYKHSLSVIEKNAEKLINIITNGKKNNNYEFINLGVGGAEKDRLLIKTLLENTTGTIHYRAYDQSLPMLEYEKDRIKIWQREFGKSRIKFEGVHGDFCDLPKEVTNRSKTLTKIYSMLGNTFGNMHENEMVEVMSKAMNYEDFLILGIGLLQDGSNMKEGYDNPLVRELMLYPILHHLDPVNDKHLIVKLEESEINLSISHFGDVHRSKTISTSFVNKKENLNIQHYFTTRYDLIELKKYLQTKGFKILVTYIDADKYCAKLLLKKSKQTRHIPEQLQIRYQKPMNNK
ncbi:MAG: L-histidine N(alpha)-methyltransferase [Nitrosotalea sp.]